MGIEHTRDPHFSSDDIVNVIGEVIQTMQATDSAIAAPAPEVERGPVSMRVSLWWTDAHERVSNDYADASGNSEDCGCMAEEIVAILLGEGKAPELLHLRGRSVDGVNTENLVPLAFDGRVGWGGHIICRADGMVYDPMLDAPEPEASYPRVAFGVNELQVRRAVPFVMPTQS